MVVRRKRSIGKGTELQAFVYDLIAYVTTNDEGEYSVPGLEPGTYRFNVPYPGIPMDTINSNIDIEVTADGAKVSKLVNATVTETLYWKLRLPVLWTATIPHGQKCTRYLLPNS